MLRAMNGLLARVVLIGTGVVVTVSSTWFVTVMSRGERLAVLETKVEYIEETVRDIKDFLLPS